MVKKKKRRELTDRELRDYYDKHSRLQEGVRIRPVKMDFPGPRVLIAMRMDEKILDELKEVAARKGINFSTLARMWLTERLREERGS